MNFRLRLAGFLLRIERRLLKNRDRRRIENRIHLRNELIPSARYRLHKAWYACIISEGLAQFCSQDVESLVRLNKSFVSPEPVAQNLLGNQFTWVLQQNKQHFERQVLDSYAFAAMEKDLFSDAYFKCAKSVTI